MQNQSLLECKGLTKRFGGVHAVKEVDIKIQAGMRMGIIGPNGAGKTTLFNMFTGEIKPSAGDIYFKGHSIHGMKPHFISKMGIGRTFQIVRVFDELSVYENVLIGAIAKNFHFKPTREQHDDVRRILSLTKLEPQKDVMAKHLTVAKKKHVGLAIALVGNPQLLLLDECMAGLTFVETDDMIEFLHKINADMGITLVVVEHVMKVVMELCENIVVIASGEKIADGSPKDIVSNPHVVDVYLGES